MATPTLDAYRQLNPQDTRSDQEIVPDLIGRLQAEGTLEQYPDLVQYAGDLDRAFSQAHRPGYIRDFSKALGGGIETGESQLYSTVGQLSDILGANKTRDWAIEAAQRHAENAAKKQPSVPTISDVHDLSDALHYGVGLVGSQVPALGATMAAAAGGAAAGSLIGPEGTVGGGLAGLGSALGATTPAAAASLGGSTLGLLGAGYVQSQNYLQLKQQNAQDAALTSAAVGAVGGVLMTIVPTDILRKAFGAESQQVAQMGMDALLDRAEQNVPGLAESLLHSVAKHGTNNALLGVGNELVSMAGEMYANRDNPDFQIGDKELTDRILNGAAAGGVLGAAFGVAGARGERIEAAKELAASKIELAKRQDAAAWEARAGIAAPTTGITDYTTGVNYPTETHAMYADLFDDAADNEAKRQAREAYDNARETSFRQSQRQAELLRNQLSQQAGGEEIKPVNFRPNGPENPPEPEPVVPPVQPTPTEPAEAPAVFHGIQEGVPEAGIPDFPLFNLTDDIPGHPKGSTVSGQTLQEAGFKVPEIPKETTPEPAPPLEHGGDAPIEPLVTTAREIPGELPKVRQEFEPVQGTKPLTSQAWSGIRKDEKTLDETKRLVAVEDKATGKVTAYPLYESNSTLRVHDGVEAKIGSRKALADALSYDPNYVMRTMREGGRQSAALSKVWNELNAGSKPDSKLEDLAKNKDVKILGFLKTEEAVGRNHFTFENRDEFEKTAFLRSQEDIISKNIKQGSGGVDSILNRLHKISPDDARGVRILASVLETLPTLQDAASGVERDERGRQYSEREARARADAGLIMSELVRSPGGSTAPTFQENLNKTTDPRELMTIQRGHLFKLFTPEQWESFKELTKRDDVTPQQILDAVDEGLKSYGWKSRGDYLNSVTPKRGQTELGAQLMERDQPSRPGAEDDNLSAQVVEQAGREGGVAAMQAAENALGEEHHPIDLPPEQGAEDKVPEKALGFVGMNEEEASIFAGMIQFSRIKEIKFLMEAREESTISSPSEDLEFQEVKGTLKNILEELYSKTRGAVPALSDEFLYGVYANLDKLRRDTQPIPSSYRETSDHVQTVFRNTVSYLAGQGVDTRLIQQNVDSAVDFLRNQWGRSITHEDGRRMVILTMQDINTPTRENLRTLYHEVAHQLFANEMPWVQRLMHEALARLTDIHSEVFSKTYDRRLLNREPMEPHVLMEEVLAEHLAFTGIDQASSRTLAQKFIDGFTKLLAQGAMVVSKLTGKVFSPELIQRYAEIRFQDVLDKVLSPATDLDTLSGNIRHTAQYEATLYRQANGKFLPEKWDSATGSFVLHDAIDDSVLASQFNLDNKLQFSDIVVRDSRADLKKNIWSKEFGVSDTPIELGKVLKTIIDHPKVTDVELKAAAMSILDRSPSATKAQIKFISTAEERKGLIENHPSGTAGVYLAAPHAVLINAEAMGGFDHNDFAFVVAHEATHAAVVRAMDAYGWYKQFKAEYKGRTSKPLAAGDLVDFLAGHETTLAGKERDKWTKDVLDSIPHIEKIEKIFDHLTAKDFNKGAYGMTDLDEFVAESVSNRAFQMSLARETLPDSLRIRKEKQSVFSSIVELVSRMFNADKKGNALESVTSGIEKIMLVADPLSKRAETDTLNRRSYYLPVSEVESDLRVKQSFENDFAHLNSQADFYHEVFDKAAGNLKLKFGDYLHGLLGIHNPEDSIAALQARAKGLGKDVGINPDMRLNDAKGIANQVKAAEDKAQITKKLVGTATDAMLRLQRKATEFKDAIEKNTNEVKRVQGRFVRFETMLNDVLAIRDNALLTMRKGLHGAERNAERMAIWAARHDGLAGIAAELFRVHDEESIPDDYAETLIDTLDEHTHDTYFTDVLTKLSKENLDFDTLTPRQIEEQIKNISARTRDQQLLALADGSPKARSELALLTYYAKTQPADMAALAIRVEEDPEQKDHILKMIKKIIRENVGDTEGLNDLFKDVRKGDVRVGKAKQALTDVAKQLSQAKKQLEISQKKSVEMELASKAIRDGLKPYQAALGIRADRFEPYNGAPIARIRDGKPERTDPEGKQYTLKLGKDSGDEVTKLMLDTKKWLDQNDRVRDPTWLAMEDQYHGLMKVSADQIDGTYRTTAMDKLFGSVADRLIKTGIPIAKQAANRWYKYFSLREAADPIAHNGYHIMEVFRDAMKITGLENSFQGFKNTIFNPGAHFLRHLQMLPHADEESNLQYAKQQLKNYFNRSDYTRGLLQKPGAFDKVWELLHTNWKEGSKPAADFAAKHGALVEDDEVKVVNPRTGEVELAKRPAMNVGLFTTQSDISKVFGIKKIIDAIKGQDGKPLWADWMEREGMPENPAALFTDDAMHHFVRPYVYDTGTLHFTSPELADGKTTTRANPLNVQAAYEAAGGDVVKFANNLFDAEYKLADWGEYMDHNQRRQQFVENTLGFFRDQYKKIYNMSKKQEQINAELGPYLLSSPMMDNVKAGDFPPEFMDYYLYDPHTLRQVLSNLSAHAALGRDLGKFSRENEPNKGILWELDAAQKSLQDKHAEYLRLSEAAKRENPAASVKDIDNYIEKQVGAQKLKEYKNLSETGKELRSIRGNVLTHFSSPNGATREMQMSQEVVRTITGGMLNNFKSALNMAYQMFEPFNKYGLTRASFKQTGRYIEASSRAGLGSFVQAITGEAKLASEWARYMSEHHLNDDPSNSITAAQILSDRGKNNMYEDQRALGWLRKGRALVFDLGFKASNPKERVAPAFRPQAPFSTMMVALDQGAIESELRFHNDLLSKGIEKMDGTPGSTSDPSFRFDHKDLGLADNELNKLAFTRIVDAYQKMGTSLETEVRQLIDERNRGNSLGSILIRPDLARLIASEAIRTMSLPNDISSAPTWFSNHPVGRLAMPLLTWSVNKTNQLLNLPQEPGGEITRRAAMGAAATLAFALTPAAVAVSLLTDQYDEQVLGKKSNLIGYNFDDAGQTAAALLERVGRVGTFGLAGDVVNGVRAYGMDGDLKGLSVDQRVVFINELQDLLGLANTLYNQGGNLSYETFYRPLVQVMGGGGVLQNEQILNNITNSVMGTPIFQREADITARLNALNYLRAAGRVSGLDVRTQSGETSLPTPVKPYIATMVNSVYGNDQSRFAEAYADAIAEAKDMGKEDPVEFVKRSFESYHPLRYSFRTPPSQSEVAQMYGAMSDKGRQDVQSALTLFNQYSAAIGLKPYEGKAAVVAKTQPSAFTPIKL